MKSTLIEKGYALWRSSLGDEFRANLRRSIFQSGEAGTRCLLDVDVVATAARSVGSELMGAGFLDSGAVAIQAIAFDKSPGVNWKVAWHQDLMFPFARAVCSPGYELPSVKAGIDFARPPAEILGDLLAVRVHLDDCDEENGPLRICPGSHRFGVIPGAEISDHVARSGEVVCTAREGEALLMRPLLLHASSKAVTPRHRRVLHFVFHSGADTAEAWHRAIRSKRTPEPPAPSVTLVHPGRTA